MADILDKETLAEMLDSNKLSEYEKQELVRDFAKQLRRRELLDGLKLTIKAVRERIELMINHRAVHQVFSSPLMRSHH